MDFRRTQVPFDSFAFEKQKREGTTYSMHDTFEQIHRSNHWNSDSRSGAGAGDVQTQTLRSSLRELCAELNIKSLLDAPCGDFSWMKDADLPLESYYGLDIVAELVRHNEEHYGNALRRFACADLSREALPFADALLCRDCLVHMSFADIERALANIKASSITYLLTTTFPACGSNQDIVTGDWRPLNMELAPFNFPPPLQVIREDCTEGDGLFEDKSLGLWRVRDL